MVMSPRKNRYLHTMSSEGDPQLRVTFHRSGQLRHERSCFPEQSAKPTPIFDCVRGIHPMFERVAITLRRSRIGPAVHSAPFPALHRSEEHTSELQSLMRISSAVFCLKTKNTIDKTKSHIQYIIAYSRSINTQQQLR